MLFASFLRFTFFHLNLDDLTSAGISVYRGISNPRSSRQHSQPRRSVAHTVWIGYSILTGASVHSHHAPGRWLDSLSEDWVSEPASETSAYRPPPSCAQGSHPKCNSSARSKGRTAVASAWLSPRENDAAVDTRQRSVLSERSLNDINIFASRRGPRNSPKRSKIQERGKITADHSLLPTVQQLGRTQYTINHKASSTSPIRSKGQTPEWKRRLVYGGIILRRATGPLHLGLRWVGEFFKPRPDRLTRSRGLERGRRRRISA